MQFQVPIRVADHGFGPTSEIKRLPRHLRAGLGEPASEEHFIQKYNFNLLHRLACRRLRLAHSVNDLRRNALRLELVEPEISESAGDTRLGLLHSEYKHASVAWGGSH